MGIILDYPYLAMSLLGLGTVLAIMALNPARRLGLLWGGLAGAPYGLLSFEFVPDYWRPDFALPVYLHGHFFFGLADIVFSFVTGALAWLFVTAWANGNLSYRLDWRRILPRFALYGLPGVALTRLLKVLIFHELPMIATFISIAVMTVVYLRLRPWLLGLSAGACWRFVAMYAVYITLMLTLFPTSRAYWDTPHQPGFSLLGLPVFEIGWAVAYGLVFPMFLLTVVEAQWQPAEAAADAAVRGSEA